MRMHAMRKRQINGVDIRIGDQRVISRAPVIVGRGITMSGIDRKRSAEFIDMQRGAPRRSHKPRPINCLERRRKSMRNAARAQNAPTNITRVIAQTPVVHDIPYQLR